MVCIAVGIVLSGPIDTASFADDLPPPLGQILEPSPQPSPEPSPEPPPPPPPPPQYPALPDGSGSGRRIVYSNSQQRVWLVEDDGNVVGSHLVSGRRGVPRPGTYRVFSKSTYTTALRGRVYMHHMTRFARGRRLAIGFHSIPQYRKTGRPIQSVEQLGTFRSSGCVRMHPDAAWSLYAWAPVGTKVVVTR